MKIVRGWNPKELLSPELAARCSDTADMTQNLWMLYALTAGMNATRILEIGVNDGTSTLALLKAAHETQGEVLSIDIADAPHAKAIIEHLELDRRWHFYQGNSRDVLPSVEKMQVPVDVILIDGDHSYAGAHSDFEFANRMLRDDGLLFVHDSYMFRDGDNPGCGFMVRDLLENMEYTGLVLPFNSSLGIFQKRKPIIRKMVEEIGQHPFGMRPDPNGLDGETK